MIAKSGILALFLTGLCYAQFDDPEKTLQDLSQHFGDPNLKDRLNQTDFNATVSQVTDALKQKCLKNADETAYDNVLKAKDTLGECIKGFIDFGKIQEEIKEASPKGELDEVFKKYCQKSPKAKDCLHDFANTMEVCFSPKERDNMKIVHNITDSLLNFICFKEGDRIALFIAESGQECLEEHSVDINNCVNSTFGVNVDTTQNLNPNDLPELEFDEKRCGKIQQLQNCVVNALEYCKQPTPANIAEALFKFVLQVTPCNQYKTQNGVNAQQSQKGDASPLAQIALLQVAALFMLTRLF